MEQEKVDPIRRLLWLDTETTGLDHEGLEVLEVAWFVTAIDLEQITSVESRVLSHLDALDLMDDFVTDMHTKNGLIDDVADSTDDYESVTRAILLTMHEVERIERQPVEWVLAGSGVGTFDMRVLERLFPSIHKCLAYFVIDVGIIRRFLRDVVGFPLSEEELATLHGFRPTDHRAPTDIVAAWKEACFYKDTILDWVGFEAVDE